MSLTKKTIVVIVSIMIPLFMALLFVSNSVIFRSFEALEKQNVERNLLRAEDAIDAKLRSLENLTQDWSGWDDTYNYALGTNPDFIENNMMDYTFTTTQLNLMMIFNNSGELLFSKAYNFVNDQEIPVPGELKEGKIQRVFLEASSQGATLSGFILTSEYPMLIISKPILDSFGSGPVAGIFISGVILDSSLIGSFSETTHLSLSVFQLNDLLLPDDFRRSNGPLAQSGSDIIQPVSRDRIAGYHVLKDVLGAPILVIRVDLPRDIYSQANTTIMFLHSFLFLVGIALFVIFILILKRVILSRIIVLDTAVQNIGKTSDKTKRVVVSGKDELARLASNINTMLDSLEQADQKITSLYEQEKKQREELEEESRARSQFIHVLAHELRTPLTPMLLALELAHDLFAKKPESLQYRLIHTASSSAESLRIRLEELLDLARFSRGTFNLNKLDIETISFLETVTSRYKPVLDQKQQELVMNFQAGLPQINADPSRLEQVLLNLLSNASKYSPEHSTITFNVSMDTQKLVFEIKDQGIGITPEEQKRIFMPYHRAQQDRQRYPGIGLGLAVCNQIVLAHGGLIWVESERNKGSSFKFTLPVCPVDTGSPEVDKDGI